MKAGPYGLSLAAQCRPVPLPLRAACWDAAQLRRVEGLTTAAVVTSFSGGPAPFCVPGYVTNDVVVAMVISFMERQPERMYEDFAALAPEAMQAAWPCKHSRQR